MGNEAATLNLLKESCTADHSLPESPWTHSPQPQIKSCAQQDPEESSSDHRGG